MLASRSKLVSALDMSHRILYRFTKTLLEFMKLAVQLLRP